MHIYTHTLHLLCSDYWLFIVGFLGAPPLAPSVQVAESCCEQIAPNPKPTLVGAWGGPRFLKSHMQRTEYSGDSSAVLKVL